jgi:putative ABC transport system ATP-binding protein
MISSASNKMDLEAAQWLIEQLLIQAGMPADRMRVRRALEESLAAWPSRADEHWWKWFYDAARLLGLQCKVIDCTFGQMLEVVRQGGRVVSRVGPEGRWQAITSVGVRRFQLKVPLRDKTSSWLGQRRLRQQMEVRERDEIFRCVVLEPTVGGVSDHESKPDDRTPLSRFLWLLRAESSDISIILIFSLATGMLALATPLAVETLVNTVAFGRVVQPVVILALVLLAALSLAAAIKALQTYVVEIIQRRLFVRTVADLAFRLPRMKLESVDRESSRELVNRFFDVVTLQKVAAQLLTDGISLVLSALIGMAVLAFYHPWLLGFNVVLLAMILFAILVLGRGAIKTSLKESKNKYKTAAWLEELAAMPTTFRFSGAPEFALERADQLAGDYLNARIAHWRILLRQICFVLGLQAIAGTVLLGMGGWLVISGELTLGQLVAAELIVSTVLGAFAGLWKHMESFYDVMASMDKLGTLFDLPVESQTGLMLLSTGRPAQLLVNDLTFPGRSGQPGLSKASFEAISGDRLILWGGSPAVHSDLLDMMYGLRQPAGGYIHVDGLDPRDVRPDALRRVVSLVRDPEVFAGTVAENVHLERGEINNTDVREALEKVGLHEVVLRLPQGLDTRLVEGGYPLTPDQARLLTLARGIVGRPSLLLIDRTLDALPDDCLDRLVDVLFDFKQPWTLVMATGRQRLAASARRIANLSNPAGLVIQEVAHVR